MLFRNSEMNPPVSIVVPVYNVGPYFKRPINSIQVQTCIDIILVDDNSIDTNLHIYDEHANKDRRHYRSNIIRYPSQAVQNGRNELYF